MGTDEPISTTTIRRPFQWGIVVVVADDWAGDLPEFDPRAPVRANERAMVIPVRHAQDSDEFEGGYLKFAEAEVEVRQVAALATTADSRRVIYRGAISVPTGTVNVGDADEMTPVLTHAGDNIAIVSVDARIPADDSSPDAVRVDFLPGSAIES